MVDLTPRQIVAELDKYIVGQNQAKKSVAVALRNRWRRARLTEELREEVTPKNILMIGPTGVGKTEIARRLAKMVNAPFIKVEATKFTEVGYVGRDVESMVRDLVETAVRMVKNEYIKRVADKAKEMVEERILDYFCPSQPKSSGRNPFELLFSGGKPTEDITIDNQAHSSERELWRKRLEAGELEDETIEIILEENGPQVLGMFSGSGMEEMGINLQDMLGSFMPKKQKHRKLTVAAARKILLQEEAQKLIDMDEVSSEAVKLAESSGIIFLDEIDKIAGKSRSNGPDVSREGVQRDILPIVEGSTVVTKYGPVKTDYILFVAAGAFHIAKPSDLIPELQGRFPIRVELNSLSEADFKQILVEPENALLKQYKALIEAEGIKIDFTEDAIHELARIACHVNEQAENIGARRLHTILEKLLEDVAFDVPDVVHKDVIVDAAYVRQKLDPIIVNQDLTQFIL